MPVRNFSGVQNEALRTRLVRGKRLDDIFNEIHDTLEESYYGDRGADGRFVAGTGWRNGQSKPFSIGARTFDVQPTREESKALFDRLHALLWDRYNVAMHRLNLSLPRGQQLDREDYDANDRDELGNVVNWKSEVALTRLDAAKNDAVRPIDFTDPTV